MAGLFGGRLAPHAEVTLLGGWVEGLEALRVHGIRLQANGETLTASVKVTDDPSACKGAQSALVLVKSWQTEAAGKSNLESAVRLSQ